MKKNFNDQEKYYNLTVDEMAFKISEIIQVLNSGFIEIDDADYIYNLLEEYVQLGIINNVNDLSDPVEILNTLSDEEIENIYNKLVNTGVVDEEIEDLEDLDNIEDFDDEYFEDEYFEDESDEDDYSEYDNLEEEEY